MDVNTHTQTKEWKQVTAWKFQNLLETFWVEETILAFYSDSVSKRHISNEHLSNTQSRNFQVKWIILQFLRKFAQNFLYIPNEEEQILFPLKIPNYEKLDITSQFDLTRFYDNP